MVEKCKVCGTILIPVLDIELMTAESLVPPKKLIGWRCELCDEVWLLKDYEPYIDYIIHTKLKEALSDISVMKLDISAMELRIKTLEEP